MMTLQQQADMKVDERDIFAVMLKRFAEKLLTKGIDSPVVMCHPIFWDDWAGAWLAETAGKTIMFGRPS